MTIVETHPAFSDFGNSATESFYRIPLSDGWQACCFLKQPLPAHFWEEWNDWAGRYGDAGIFLGPFWYETWWDAFQSAGGLCIILLEHNGKSRGIFPCLRRRVSGKRLTLAPLANDHTFYYDFLLSPDDPYTSVSRFLELGEALKPAFPLSWGDFSVDRPTGAILADTLRQRRLPYHRDAWPSSPWVDLRGTWEDYEGGLHSKLKNNLRKGRRRAEREGPLLFEAVKDSPVLESLLTEIFEVEDRSWKGRGGTSIKSNAGVESFYRALAHRAARTGAFRLYVLRWKGQAIAFDFCLAGGRTLFALKTGYDESTAARFSAGNLMRRELLKHLITGGEFHTYNFLGPAYPWKMEWNARNGTYENFHIYSANWRGRGQYFFHHGWKTTLKRIAMSVSRNWKKAAGRS